MYIILLSNVWYNVDMKYETLNQLKKLGIIFTSENLIEAPSYQDKTGNLVTDGEPLCKPDIQDLIDLFDGEVTMYCDKKSNYFEARTSPTVGLFSQSSDSIVDALGTLLIRYKTYLGS